MKFNILETGAFQSALSNLNMAKNCSANPERWFVRPEMSRWM